MMWLQQRPLSPPIGSPERGWARCRGLGLIRGRTQHPLTMEGQCLALGVQREQEAPASSPLLLPAGSSVNAEDTSSWWLGGFPEALHLQVSGLHLQGSPIWL